jgi:hypothetical protein
MQSGCERSPTRDRWRWRNRELAGAHGPPAMFTIKAQSTSRPRGGGTLGCCIWHRNDGAPNERRFCGFQGIRILKEMADSVLRCVAWRREPPTPGNTWQLKAGLQVEMGWAGTTCKRRKGLIVRLIVRLSIRLTVGLVVGLVCTSMQCGRSFTFCGGQGTTPVTSTCK